MSEPLQQHVKENKRLKVQRQAQNCLLLGASYLHQVPSSERLLDISQDPIYEEIPYYQKPLMKNDGLHKYSIEPEITRRQHKDCCLEDLNPLNALYLPTRQIPTSVTQQLKEYPMDFQDPPVMRYYRAPSVIFGSYM
jgi:hypothetical protein